MQVVKSGKARKSSRLLNMKRTSIILFTVTNQNDNNSSKHNKVNVHANSATEFNRYSPIVPTTLVVAIVGVHEKQASSSQPVCETEEAPK